MFKYSSKSEYILALATSSQRIEAVLMHDAPTGPMIIRTFSRKRAGNKPFEVDRPAAAVDVPSDVSFSTPDESGMDSSLFLSSEFGGLPATQSKTDAEMMPPSQHAVPCDIEIQDIVNECADAGYENVKVVFALPTGFLGVEVLQPESGEADSKSDRKKSKTHKKSQNRDSLLKQLKLEYPSVDDRNVSFLPLSGFQGRAESQLAVFAQSTEPVSISLSTIRDRNRPFPNVGYLENEITLLLGAARAALITEQRYDVVSEVVNDVEGKHPGEEETSVLIRVGAEDTVVMFLTGQDLVHYESLRSITAYDPAETICSRILLMHDEFGAGDSDRILLFCDDAEKQIGERLAQVFPDSHITLLRGVLPPFEEVRKKPVETETLLAILAALRSVRDELWQVVFPGSDFLDPKLRGRKFTLPFSWPVAAMVVILFGTTLFFVYRYFEQSHDLEMTRYELRNYPEAMIAQNADDLQMKIDSLRSRSSGFAEALDLLDSLLIGSDTWSRALERTSVHTGDVTGLWIERWGESSPGTLAITGTAMDRDQIVRFAAGAEANIENMLKKRPINSSTSKL